MVKTVILTGRPGSGKGTQGKLLAGAHGWTHFSTGEEFRILREQDSALGNRVRGFYDSGKLLPDWFATYLFERAVLSLDREAGIICEGYPRSLAQAHAFDEVISWLERPYVVIDLEVSDGIVEDRMLKRAGEENRPDSGTAAKIQVRLATYHEHTAPVLEFFKERGMLHTVDGSKTMEEVTVAISQILA